MRDYVIFCDSCSDLSKDKRDAYGIKYYKMQIVLEGNEKPADLDWNEYSVEEFYSWLSSGKKLKTTQVPLAEFIKESKKVLDEGKDILYISCSGALSGSINVFNLAKEQLLEEYKDATLIGVDSLNASAGIGYMVIKAALNKKDGMDIVENANWLEANKLKFNQFCTVETLKFLKAAGRVKASAAFFGDIIGVKPIIISDKNGNNLAIKKERGTKNSLNALFEGIKSTIDLNASNVVRISHANALDRALYLKKRFEEELHATVDLDIIGPIIGTSAGPGTIAVYCYGQEVTVSEESLKD